MACAIGAFRLWDRVSFGVMIGVSVFWSLTAIGGWVAGDVPRGLITGGLWLGVAAVTYVVATWPEPPEALRRERR